MGSQCTLVEEEYELKLTVCCRLEGRLNTGSIRSSGALGGLPTEGGNLGSASHLLDCAAGQSLIGVSMITCQSGWESSVSSGWESTSANGGWNSRCLSIISGRTRRTTKEEATSPSLSYAVLKIQGQRIRWVGHVLREGAT